MEVFLVRRGAADELALTEPVRPGADYTEGVRVAEVGDLDEGTYELRVRLLAENGYQPIERPMLVQVRGRLVVTALLTRSCEGVRCPTADRPEAVACLGGVCVEPECTPETPGRCDVGECEEDADCTSTAPCRASQCLVGACFHPPVEGACAPTEWCHPERGCVDTDEGVVDAGAPVDGGAPLDGGAFDGGTVAPPDGRTVTGSCDPSDPCVCPAGETCVVECPANRGCFVECEVRSTCYVDGRDTDFSVDIDCSGDRCLVCAATGYVCDGNCDNSCEWL